MGGDEVVCHPLEIHRPELVCHSVEIHRPELVCHPLEIHRPRSRLQYWFRHPIARLINVATFSLFNCVLFSKDPIGYSPAEAQIPVFGPAMKFLLYLYPFLDVWGLLFKTSLAIIYLITGMLFGKYIFHDYFLRDRLGMAMFNRDKGSWFCMAIASLWSLYTGCFVFNILDDLWHPNRINEDYEEIGDGIGITFARFHEFLSPFSLTFNIFTFVMVLDDILQDRDVPGSGSSSVRPGDGGGHVVGYGSRDPYPTTWVILKDLYRTGSGAVRMIIFWMVMVGLIVMHVFVNEFERLDHHWIHADLIPVMSEFGRSLLASIVTAMELLCIMQDEEFPRFSADHCVRLVGLNSNMLSFVLRNYEIVITGKWFNYSLVIFTMCVNLIMVDYSFTYNPAFYHQSIDPNGNIIYSGGVLEKATYKNVPAYIMSVTLLPMVVVVVLLVYCMVSDTKLKRKEQTTHPKSVPFQLHIHHQAHHEFDNSDPVIAAAA